MGGSDGQLLSQARNGDEQALTELLQQHGPAVRRWVAGRIPRRWRSILAADDVMQQSYTDAFLDLGQFDGGSGGSFSAWLMTIAKCNLADAVRMLDADKRGKGRRPVALDAQQDSFVALYELLAVTQSTPSRHAARAEAHSALEQAVRQLPEDYRQVVQMYDLEGRSVEEVGAAVGRKPGAVYMMRARAHRRLGLLLGGASNYFSAS